MKPLTILIAASLVTLLASFWKRNDLPRHIDLVPDLVREPLQVATNKPKFTARFNDVDYLVEPEYDYDLVGLVVSYRHHDGNSRMHTQANDHLNMLDVCVVWGGNAANPRLTELTFWNGIFTCNVETRSREAWESFDMTQLSNNHLISADAHVRDQVKGLRVGDQIRVRGYLSSYSNEGGGKRGTSTTRVDTGDGACETLFVEQFDILQPAGSRWRMAMWLSLAVLLLASIAVYRRPYRPYRAAVD